MLISIRHTQKIGIADPVPRLLLHLLMTPQSGPTQRVTDWTLTIGNEAHEVPLIDGFGNKVLFASLNALEAPLEITVSGTVDTLGGNGVLGWPMGEPVPWLYHRMTPSTRVPVSVWGKFRGEASQPDNQLAVLHDLMARIHEMLDERAEHAEQSQSQTQPDGGMTQSQIQGQTDEAEAENEPDPAIEYARTFVGSARSLGIPARFVSGYCLAPGDGDFESGVHAWAEAYVEGLGWIDFDPRLDVCPTDRHVRVAVGLDAETAIPIRAHPAVGETAIPVETVEIDVAEATAQ